MDVDLWDLSQLGRRTQRDGSPGARARRMRARHYVGRRLRQWRLSQGITQPEAHRRLGFGGDKYRAGVLEMGEMPWRPQEVEALADVLGGDVDELLRQAIHADDPDVERRREEMVAYALTLDRASWDALVAAVEARRLT